MSRSAQDAPADLRALVAIDLGAESCRVSLLRWVEGDPVIRLVHRFPNAPRETESGLRWDLGMIEEGLLEGLRLCAAQAPEGARAIAADGWAVDYVFLGPDGKAVADPFCYRDERTVEAEESLHRCLGPERMRELTGIQLLRINTLYQLHADVLAGAASMRQARWLNLPEYILFRLGARPVAELTNASHTQMIDLKSGTWCTEIFSAAGLDATAAPEIVQPGTRVGRVSGDAPGGVGRLPAYSETALVAPACHDTASAIAGIPAGGEDWAYISSGTWSLVGTTLDRPNNSPAACEDNFTNLAVVGGRVLFHKNVNGMWLLRQSMEYWAAQGKSWTVPELVEAAEKASAPEGLLDVDEPDLMLAGDMPLRINAQRVRRGLKPLDESVGNGPEFASLIFHSLAARYAAVLARIAQHTGKRFERLFVVGGASQNLFLNRLTGEATGLKVIRGSQESSTVGNFAVQLATLEKAEERRGVSAEDVSRWAAALQPTRPL